MPERHGNLDVCSEAFPYHLHPLSMFEALGDVFDTEEGSSYEALRQQTSASKRQPDRPVVRELFFPGGYRWMIPL
jgi:hypothetical protein